MAASAVIVYKILYRLTSVNIISLLPAILVAVIVYCSLVLALKILTPDEIEQLPMGNKLVSLIKRTPFYR